MSDEKNPFPTAKHQTGMMMKQTTSMESIMKEGYKPTLVSLGGEPLVPIEGQEEKMIKKILTGGDSYDVQLKKAIEYNKNVTTFDPLYSSILPVGSNCILLRMFVKEPINMKGNLIIPLFDKVSIRTHNNQGTLKEIDNPFRYQTKGVVVALEPNLIRRKELEIGDVVVTNSAMAVATIPGNSDIIEVTYGFTHPEWSGQTPPKDMTDRHYGYLLVPLSFIRCKLPVEAADPNQTKLDI